MCYAKPGPRCSNHASVDYVKARHAVKDAGIALRALKDDPSSSQEEILNAEKAYGSAHAKLAQARDEYEETPEFYNKVQEKLQDNASGNRSDLNDLRLRAELGKERREQKIHNFNLAKKAKSLAEQNSSLIQDSESRSFENTVGIENTSQTFEQAQKENQDATMEVETARRDVESAFRSHRFGRLPGMWESSPEIANSGAYQRFTEAKAQQQMSEIALEHAKTMNTRTHFQLGGNQSTERLRRAAYQSDFGGNSETYDAYGQTHYNQDGTTNAYYLTRIPQTSVEVFANVRKVEGNQMTLETGEVVSLSKANTAHFVFTKPEDNAQRGPEVFRMDSSG